MSSKDLLKEALSDIIKVAKKAGIEPYTVTKGVYYSNDGKISEWEFRKLGGLSSLVKAHFETPEGKDLGLITDIKQVRQYHQKLEREMGNQELFISRIKESVASMPKLKMTPYKARKPKDDESRTVNLNLSDLHFGSDLTEEENGHKWGIAEESRAIAKVVENVIEYKRQYRDNTKLVVNLLGDIIQNELHGKTTAGLLHLQTCRAIWLLQQVVARFAEHFNEVQVNMTSGNHGRDTSIHQQRAIHMKFNSLETTIYFAVRTALQHLPNVKFYQPMTPWINYESQGHKVYATHGDTHLSPGNPSKSVNVGSLENQINKINASLKDSEEYKVFIVGHVHLPLITQLPNGAYIVVNGALTPPDSFAQSLNIMESQQNQVLFESTKKYAVGDSRFINTGDSSSRKDLDKLIVPFKGL